MQVLKLRDAPDFAQVLFRRMHKRFEQATAHMLALGRFDGMERICAFIADLTRRTGARHGDRWHVRLRMSRGDIADYLGLNTDTISRLLTRVSKDGLVLFRSHDKCEIPDLKRLEARIPVAIGPGFQEAGCE